ncbi:MAG: hypothetical protein ABI231_02555 [Candidatus Tumulicola sp.]
MGITVVLGGVLSACGGSGGPGPVPPAVNRLAKLKHGTASVTVDPSQVGAAVSNLVLGANMAVWYNVTLPGIASSMTSVGLKATRWPGGSAADWYHWQNNSGGPGVCAGHPSPNSTFDNFMQDVARPAGLDVALAVNYGSNAACTAGGDPSEAAAWVAYANATQGYDITWWTVGNEPWNTHEIDLNSQPHSSALYASIEASQFYPQMKAASPIPINVCVDVNPKIAGWDATVLAQAAYDCVELHYYAQGNTVDDGKLLTYGAARLTTEIEQLENELSAAGHPNTPIYLGEIGSTGGVPGKQTQSIVQALYAGQVIGELLRNGIPRATWWMAYGGCDLQSQGGDFDRSLYGWQTFGGAMIFADQQLANGCPTPAIPATTPLATARAFQVASYFVRGGEHMLGATVAGFPNVRAYASTYAGGYAVMLFNLSQATAQNVPVAINGKSSGSGGTIVTYDKSLYDASQNNQWQAPTVSALSSWTGSFTVTLPPWSMVVVQTQ